MKLPWMSRSDMKRWKNARAFRDVTELMALWLEGEGGSWPGYQPRHGPDDETLLWTGVLAAVNRAGYLTIGSQPGFCRAGFDGKIWEQRAAVEGFVAAADRRAVPASSGLRLPVLSRNLPDLNSAEEDWPDRDGPLDGGSLPRPLRRLPPPDPAHSGQAAPAPRPPCASDAHFWRTACAPRASSCSPRSPFPTARSCSR